MSAQSHARRRGCGYTVLQTVQRQVCIVVHGSLLCTTDGCPPVNVEQTP